ncbi:UDP-N-acetylmuramate--L-alanyl-gamma-D-glutamyl-meso-2,6-diaminoheptandioate ligase-like [Ylistrum balloti]|uniref:UDP-N-acetylmuramate--L-alanyl-gamma-D-glutamyl- meso-2,6-diaminoheptandioate ligase-like n=1 Tax=Ylistrum balloti TaxID=509963 RepID=UPI002905CB9B|nr:UDP-N-acetylmuramate--L-alanyl-gamma-D-glutamyl-meso-2,6-diaminoheptandioate ligase-like [Ylistrum balloti]
MSALCRILLDWGLEVYGSDLRIEPPVGPALESWGVPVSLGYEQQTLALDTELVVVGNAVTASNVVAKEAQLHGMSVTHMPALLNRLLGTTRQRIVITGTHGKSTTSAIVAWLLKQADKDPGWFIGATPDFGPSGCLGSGPFVIEGDEYNASFFDRDAKFFHYAPNFLGITNVEFDHADLYKDLAEIEVAFRKLLQSMPVGGVVVLADDAKRFLNDVPEHVEGFVLSECGFLLQESNRDGVEFMLAGQRLSFPLPGHHEAVDAAIAALLVHRIGLDWEQIKAGLASYPGLRLRQEVLLHKPVRIIRDFGHHPTEVRVTLAGLRDAWPEQPITVVFEPRSYTSRTDRFRLDYVDAFSAADRVLIAPVYNPSTLKEPALNTYALADAIGNQATAFAKYEILWETICSLDNRQGVVIFFSNGTMNQFPERFVEEVMR